MAAPNKNTSDEIATALAKIGLALKSQGQRTADEHGLSPLQVQILAVIHGMPSPPRLSALADELAIKRATASVAVSTLEEKGMLRRRADPEDGRASLLCLTAKGSRRASSFDAWQDLMGDVVGDLSTKERSGFLVVLIKMIRSLQLRGKIPIARMCVSCKHFRPNVHSGRTAPHHCAFVDAPLPISELRIDCMEHELESSAAQLQRHWKAFLASVN